MAKKSMSWNVVDSVLVCKHLDHDDHEQEFAMSDLFDGMDEMNEVQVNLIAYGAKQKMADSCARSKDMTLTPEERIEQLNTVWERLCNGEWNTKGVSRQTMNKKIEAAKEEATEEELEVLKKLGLI